MNASIGKPVGMTEVPIPTTRAGRWRTVYEKVASLKTGQALPVTFGSDVHAYYARAALRKIAKSAGERLLSSWDKPNLTMYLSGSKPRNNPAFVGKHKGEQ